jgi:hypothetical protein
VNWTIAWIAEAAGSCSSVSVIAGFPVLVISATDSVALAPVGSLLSAGQPDSELSAIPLGGSVTEKPAGRSLGVISAALNMAAVGTVGTGVVVVVVVVVGGVAGGRGGGRAGGLVVFFAGGLTTVVVLVAVAVTAVVVVATIEFVIGTDDVVSGVDSVVDGLGRVRNVLPPAQADTDTATQANNRKMTP